MDIKRIYNKVLLENFFIDLECNDKPFITPKVDWTKTQKIDFVGFESAEFNMCDKSLEVILYRFNLAPLNINTWVYYHLKEHKIIAIIQNQDNVTTE